jgi:tetratricopeptide (TPR) repeat protein
MSSNAVTSDNVDDAIVHARRTLEAGKLDDAERLFVSLIDSVRAAEAYKGIGDVLLRKGRLDGAAQAYRAALKLRSDWPEVLNNLGNVDKFQGNVQSAEQYYRRALTVNPLLAEPKNNLGVLLAEKGAVEEAVNLFRDATSAAHPARDARRNLATALALLGKVEEALTEFEQALEADPNDADTLVGMASLLRASGQGEPAFEFASRALRLRPGFSDAYLEAGRAAHAMRRIEDALSHCRNAVEASPNSAQAREALGAVLLDFGAPQDAAVHLLRALALKPNSPGCLFLLARAFEEQERLGDAEDNYRAALKALPDNLAVINRLGDLLLKRGKAADGLSQFERACQLQPERPAGYNNIAVALHELGKHQEAADYCHKAISLNPNIPEPYMNLGSIQQTLGQLDDARELYERALELNPDLVPAIFSATNLRNSVPDHEAVTSITSLLDSKNLKEAAKAQLYFALVRINETIRDYGAAFEAARQGNAIQARREVYDFAKFERLIAALEGTFTAGFFKSRESFGARADKPIFIVGMPRSGTTLVEQVLASHHAVFGGGELLILPQLLSDLKKWGQVTDNFPQGVAELTEPAVLRIAGAYRRHTRALAGPGRLVTDKLLSNAFHLGAIALLFPSAKVIYCRRDPMDTFISSYFTLFRHPIPYATDQKSFAHFYRLHERLFAHWRRVLPFKIHEVEYEKFVAAQESQTRVLLAYCGLEWDPRCLEFHRTVRPVRTGSDIQVRQPLYSTSVGHSEPYKEQLKTLHDKLTLPSMNNTNAQKR